MRVLELKMQLKKLKLNTHGRKQELIDRLNSQPIKFFGGGCAKTKRGGEYIIFSNYTEYNIIVGGKNYPTTEHFYQAAKFFDTDPEYSEKIRCAESAGVAKKLGSSKTHKLNPIWDEIKIDVMRHALKCKIKNHPEIRELLVNSDEREIIEASPWDKYWGSGMDGSGKNMLGKLWMELRAEIYNNESFERMKQVIE
jgi:ribA/ribD-fused uncharacterized protein